MDKAHGKGRGKGIQFWLDLIYAAIGDGLLTLRFCAIRAAGLFRYQIAATLSLTEKGVKCSASELEWDLPCIDKPVECSTKKTRCYGGSHLLPLIENLLSSSDNWYEVVDSSGK